MTWLAANVSLSFTALMETSTKKTNFGEVPVRFTIQPIDTKMKDAKAVIAPEGSFLPIAETTATVIVAVYGPNKIPPKNTFCLLRAVDRAAQRVVLPFGSLTVCPRRILQFDQPT